mmetsp:Transcript_28630/g.54075  ORF Transcript_28630/g.54075 Transcript_28630/m.54075 type:complete len:366 (-) Transcript_28630:55-1152(-)
MGLFGRGGSKKSENAAGPSDPDGVNPADLEDEDEKKMTLKERQTWQIILGDKDENEKDMSALRKKLGRTEQVYTLSNIDREDLDEDRTFQNLFHRIEQVSDKSLSEPHHYKLQYDFPGSPLLMNVDFGVHDQVMTAFDKFATLSKKKFGRLRFRICPKQKGAVMFRLDKPKTVKTKLDNRNNINRYLAEDFVRGNIEIETYSKIMSAKMTEAKGLLATHLAETVPAEFKDHQYLVKTKDKKKKHMTLEEKYDKGEITIEEFEDIKYPELKEKREKAKATYPFPEKLDRCVICNAENCAAIQCLECQHKACKSCVYREFTTHPSRRPFLLMHSIFCCKRGIPLRGYLPPVKKLHEEQYSRHPDMKH